MRKAKIILIGGGGHCKSCIDVIEQSNQYSILGIIDLKEKIGNKILGYPIIGADENILAFKTQTDFFLLTIGQIGLPKRRKELFDYLKMNKCIFATVISPLAYVSKHAIIGEGTIIMHQAIVNASASVGCNSIINSKVLIEHDAVIGDHCHIATGGIINGGVIIGDNSFMGTGVVSKEYITVPEGSFVKANSIIK